MAGIENCLRPQTARVLAGKARVRRAERLGRFDVADAELQMEPGEWLDALADRPDNDDSQEGTP